jgi:hypothetical protein
MDAAALWQRYKDWLYYHEGLGFYLDVSRMGFDDAFVAEMQPRFDKAFADMAALEAGAIANPDENRMVGHYWLRDADLAPTPELKQDILDTLTSIEQFASQVRTGGITPPRPRSVYRCAVHRHWWLGPGAAVCRPGPGARLSAPRDSLYRQHRPRGH